MRVTRNHGQTPGPGPFIGQFNRISAATCPNHLEYGTQIEIRSVFHPLTKKQKTIDPFTFSSGLP
jgi:hypothetical protein